MGKVEHAAELESAWQTAARYEGSVLAERWIDGKEYTVAILGQEALPAIRLETPHAFYDYSAKYEDNSTRYLCPCGLDEEEEARLQRLALSVFRALGAHGWGRVDLMCDEEDRPWIIEINTIPGMTDHSLVPMAARAAGIEFDELVWRILETTVIAEQSGMSAGAVKEASYVSTA